MSKIFSQMVADHCIFCSGVVTRHKALLSLFLARRMFGWEPFEIMEGQFRDLTPGMAYPLCSSLRCEDCGGVFLDLRPDQQCAARYYRDYQEEAFFSERERLEPSFKERRKLFHKDDFAGECSYLGEVEAFISPHLNRSPNSILDWGGGDGSGTPFKDVARKLDIVDVNIGAIKRFANDGVHNISDVDVEEIDLIVSRHVLEHLSYPLETLHRIREIALTHDSLVYVEVPYEPFMRVDHGAVLPIKIWTEHINFFTPNSLLEAIRAARLSVLKWDTFDTGNLTLGTSSTFQVIRVLARA